MSSSTTAIVLAAGKGTRLKSDRPKVLQEVAGQAMLAYVLETGFCVAGRGILVLSADLDRDVCEGWANLVPVVQKEALGTADAVRTALKLCDPHKEHLLILYGDTPLMRPATVSALIEKLEHGADIAVCGFRSDNPAGYGRLVVDGSGALVEILEPGEGPVDSSVDSNLCNGGVMALRKGDTAALLEKIPKDPQKGEYYLTRLIALGARAGLKCAVVLCAQEELVGADTPQGLVRVRALMQQRLRSAALESGVSFEAPETVFLSHDTHLASGVHVEPHVVFAPGVHVDSGVRIRAFSYLEGVRVSSGAIIGPFARLRPGSIIGEDARIGNFVEVKQADVGRQAHISHLAYIGDAEIGERVNIGAGVITCNYDGYEKHPTKIARGAFIGSNSSLVAPVEVGEGAYVGSGSVITEDVASDALAVGRSRQRERPGWARRRRLKNKRV